ncbi:hypothetical protein [Dictyobacter formicarum]|uniref:Uncharacterized protein n=1 Tax=Dictyobacter formicarum TaxID=2778368 RepID=A0ABQ3VV86_9CHLR|nr:hypothetical protein [Dictyobacter formicarum]GHO89544.1 hypothetical protein KSZ_75500 [Dictyobacter formicarum]
MENQQADYRQALYSLTHSVYRAGVGLGRAPMSMLPRESQQEFKAAGTEFVSGLAKLAYGFATTLDKMAR